MGSPPVIVASSAPVSDAHDASTYAAWLDGALVEADEIVPRLRQAALDLQRVRGGWQGAELTRACALMEDLLALVDFALLEKRGWFARLWGRSARSAREFIAQHDGAVQQSKRLASIAREFAQTQEAGVASVQRPLLELEMECRTLGESVSQATQWLECLSATLRSSGHGQNALFRYAAAASPRLERLHQDWTSTLEVLARWRACTSSHEAFMDLLSHEWAAALGSWLTLTTSLVEEVEQAGPAGPPQQPVRQAHKDLRRLVHRVHAYCSHLKHDEDQLAQALAAMDPAYR